MKPGLWLEVGAAIPRELDWLADGERERLAAMRFPRRRHDFRRGRWAVKRALARALALPETRESLAQLEVRADGRGAPFACLRGERLPCDLSLSHRAGAALCAVAPAGTRIGCDVEWVEPRSRAFARHFLAANDRRWLDSLPEPSRAEAANLLWSARESAVKAFGTGLDVDVRTLEVRVTEDRTRFDVRALRTGQALHGRWGRHRGWLWTVASPRPLGVLEPASLRDGDSEVHGWQSAAHGSRSANATVSVG